MNPWTFSDGTIVSLGGEVEGASLFAQQLRAALADSPSVQLEPIPSDGIDLDPSDPALLNAWLEQEVRRPYREWMGVHLVSAPDDLPALPAQPTPSADDVPADAVY